MLEKSLLSKKIIVSLIKEKYNLNIIKSRKINRGSANIYKLEDINGNIYILKEFQLKYIKEDIDKEINIIKHLERKGLKVPEYIQMENKDFSFVYSDHVVTLQRFIEGYTKNKNTGTCEQTIESAKYLGKIVNALEDYKHDTSFKPSSWFEISFDKTINKYKELISLVREDKYKDKIIDDLNDKINMLEELKKVDFSNIDKVSIKFTHGDYSIMQFIYMNEKINSIIDFVSATDMPIIWEIIRSYSYIYYKNKGGKFDIDCFIEYVKEYLKHSELNEYDLQYMPYIYLIQLLKSTFGYKQYIESNNLSLLRFGIYRTNICRYLIINSEKISKRLLEEIKI